MKSTNERFDLLEDTQNSLFFLAQCCAKPEKVTQASAGQEWANKLSINIAGDADYATFVTDCLQNEKKKKKN